MSLGTASLIGLVVVAALIWFYLRLRHQDELGALLEKRRPTSKLVGRAKYVEGAEQIDVALALTEDTFYYENEDLQASFELRHLDQIEYDDELATGRNLEGGSRVLRLRSHGVTFEFVLEPGDYPKWLAALAPTRGSEARAI